LWTAPEFWQMNRVIDCKPSNFHHLAMETFLYQAAENPVYHQYLALLGCDPESISAISQVPFMPIEFYKTHRVVTGPGIDIRIFESSGTTGSQTSKHYLLNESVYQESLESGFRLFFGEPSEFCFLALLPSYLERQNSSLVFMMDYLIRQSRHPLSGFYLENRAELARNLELLEKSGQKTMLIGVTFALVDFAGQFPMPLKNTVVVETGGMKGRREELTRNELHTILRTAFGVESICSEYGMTELLSQAWSTANGIYRTPPWMKILIRDPYDPFRLMPAGKTGGIDVIDLANRYSCSFIQTQDLGRLNSNGSFEVLGRFDNSDLRGCNLMI
jgi:phenylacetate-coenzyme A ligase PaaK-like adenylate-forming protein